MSRFDAILNRQYTPSRRVPKESGFSKTVNELNEKNEITPQENGLLSLNSLNSYRVAGKKPFLTSVGELVIPRDCPSRYHYWKEGGQSLRETLQEMGASSETLSRYLGKAGLHD